MADVAQAGAKLRELEPKTSGNLYNAARPTACATGSRRKISRLPRRARKPSARGISTWRLACLKEAIAADFNDFDDMQQDSDLAALGDLPEFRSLLPQPAGK